MMLRTLRRWLLASHLLPLLVILPLSGIALIFVLESQVVLPSVADGLLSEAHLLAGTLGDRPELWKQPENARALLDPLRPDEATRAMLLSPTGALLASNDPADASRLGQVLASDQISRTLAGEAVVRTKYSQGIHADIADILAPVYGPDGQVLGLVRLSYRLTGIEAWFARLRYFVAAVLAVALVLGGLTGWLLADQLDHDLRRTTRAVYQLASDQRLEPLPERGPEELRVLSHAVNVLAERRRSVEKANRQLLSNLVHELGRPLGALYSAIQALHGGGIEVEAFREELLDGMAAEVDGLQRLLDDLAQLHRRVTEHLDLERRSVEMSTWLSSLLAPWREAAKAKGMAWETAIPEQLPEIWIDPERMRQVLGNLLSNAIKYTGADGRIRIAAGRESGGVWIRVEDTGAGIAPEEREKIFTPFYRAPRSDDGVQGMGLGLTIARDLVVAHGGRIGVKSTPGVGSTFTVWLPLEATPHSVPHPARPVTTRPVVRLVS
jgi:two-component system sensor histidine kinase BaeS